LVNEIILYYDARSKKHQITEMVVSHWCSGEGEGHASKGWYQNCMQSPKSGVKVLIVFDIAPGYVQYPGLAHPNIQF
jgi:hypothetical protein